MHAISIVLTLSLIALLPGYRSMTSAASSEASQTVGGPVG